MSDSLPVSPKTTERIESGYAESDFADNYWTTPDASGNRRIDRSATTIIRVVKRLVETNVLPANPHCLDIGAGPGNMVRDFIAAGFRCEGCEFSESGRRLAHEQFGITLKPCDLRERIPHENSQFDFAYCVGVLTMIPQQRLLVAFSEMHRILKLGGILHINLQNPNSSMSEPHLTNLTHRQWWDLLREVGLMDATSLWPPQREGIGMNDEFCGLFLAL